MVKEKEGTQKQTSVGKQLLLAIVALLLLGGIGYGVVASGVVDLSRFTNNPPAEQLLARVNGESIQKALFEARFEQTKSSYEAQGTTFAEKDIEILKQQVLDNIINEMLFRQYGKKQGMTVTEEMIENEYQKIAAQFPSQEEFQKHLAVQGATSEDIRFVISAQLMVQQIVDQQVAEHPIEVSEEEIRQVYDKAVEGGSKVPPFEEVKMNIEQQLRQQKIGRLMDAFIGQLRAEGTIEILG